MIITIMNRNTIIIMITMMIMMKIIAIKIIKIFFDNNYYDKNNDYLTIFTHILQN